MISEQKRHLVERIGLFNEHQGMQPAAARVMGLLLVSEEGQLTFEEIQQELGISKSAVSQSLSLLISQRQVEYITLPGQRKRYFRLRADGWRFHIEDTIEGALEYSKILREVLRHRDARTPELNQSITQLIGLLELLHKTLKETVKAWQEAYPPEPVPPAVQNPADVW
ncbi:MAG: MarR family transcriptional regulator [Bacteroidia bacterium]|nr:MarR family transcriptional regulator [Bacteroidia bacterium]